MGEIIQCYGVWSTSVHHVTVLQGFEVFLDLVFCNISVELCPRFRFQFNISTRFTNLKLKSNQMDLVGCIVLNKIYQPQNLFFQLFH